MTLDTIAVPTVYTIPDIPLKKPFPFDVPKPVFPEILSIFYNFCDSRPNTGCNSFDKAAPYVKSLLSPIKGNAILYGQGFDSICLCE
jgi:hypothetical protein